MMSEFRHHGFFGVDLRVQGIVLGGQRVDGILRSTFGLPELQLFLVEVAPQLCEMDKSELLDRFRPGRNRGSGAMRSFFVILLEGLNAIGDVAAGPN